MKIVHTHPVYGREEERLRRLADAVRACREALRKTDGKAP